MKKCKACQTEIDDKAKKCPQCHADLRNWFVRHPILTGIIGLILLGSIVSAVQGGNSSTSNNTSNNSSSQGNNPSNEAKVYAQGEDVKVEDVRWKLVSARDRGSVLKAADSNYPTIAEDKTSSSGRYIEVTLEVENLGKEMKSVTSQKLVDDKGREFTSASNVSEWIPQDKRMFLLSNLNPNVPQQFIDIYEVPTDATGLKVKVGDLNLFGDKEAEISLGL